MPGVIRWQHQTVTADSDGLVGGVSPYNSEWGEILQFGGWAQTDNLTATYEQGEGAGKIPLVGMYPSFNGEGEFVQGAIRFMATPGAQVRVHSWSFTVS